MFAGWQNLASVSTQLSPVWLCLYIVSLDFDEDKGGIGATLMTAF